MSDDAARHLPPDDATAEEMEGRYRRYCECGEPMPSDESDECENCTHQAPPLDRCAYEGEDTDCAARIARAHREYSRHGSILIDEWPTECAYCRSPAGKAERLRRINRR